MTNRLSALGAETVHVVVDMQRLFAEATDWQVPGFADILPPILNLARAHPRVQLRWIKAHDGSRWNEYADALASAYMRKSIG